MSKKPDPTRPPFIRITDKVERFGTLDEAMARKPDLDFEVIVDTRTDEMWEYCGMGAECDDGFVKIPRSKV